MTATAPPKPRLFGTDGIRAPFGEPRVVLGGDTRASSAASAASESLWPWRSITLTPLSGSGLWLA
ncbi:MAG TPA: hypothetical protein VHM02_12730, partial [Thermoanaerobaculia bacterium]|nr:hypothetical protein [Thermoanaerobaculia bacterium]